MKNKTTRSFSKETLEIFGFVLNKEIKTKNTWFEEYVLPLEISNDNRIILEINKFDVQSEEYFETLHINNSTIDSSIYPVLTIEIAVYKLLRSLDIALNKKNFPIFSNDELLAMGFIKTSTKTECVYWDWSHNNNTLLFKQYSINSDNIIVEELVINGNYNNIIICNTITGDNGIDNFKNSLQQNLKYLKNSL